MREHTSVGLFLTFCTVILLAQPVSAMTATPTVIASWDFGPSSAYYTESPSYYLTVTEPTLEIGGGEKDTNGKNGTEGQAAAWDDIKVSGVTDAYWIITVDTTGFSGILLSWSCKSELATCFDLAYRTSADGEWIQILDNYNVIIPGWDDNVWNNISIYLANWTVLDNQSFLQFRVDDLVEGDGNKKFAFDNLEISAIVPEPATMLLLGVGAIFFRKTK